MNSVMIAKFGACGQSPEEEEEEKEETMSYERVNFEQIPTQSIT